MDFHVLIVTAVMIVLDVVVGFAGAVRNKDVQSAKLCDELWHKAGFVGLIALAYITSTRLLTPIWVSRFQPLRRFAYTSS